MPFYFDLADRGAAGDPAARKFVVAVKPALGGRRVPTPPVLFMTADGELVGEVGNYAPTGAVLAAMRKALRTDGGRYAAQTAQEKALSDPVARAKLHFDLLEDERALEILEGAQGEEAAYLRGRLLRLRGKWAAMRTAFEKVTSPQRLDDVRMEQAHELWQGKRYEALARHMKDFPRASNRYTEARYYEGLAHFHLGKKDAAMEIWKATVTGCAQDPWIYRADWAYTQLRRKPGSFFSSAGPRDSLLGRIGYMGGGNPDLKGP